MNTITIELCAEDRARLDAILEALKGIKQNCDSCVTSAINYGATIAQDARKDDGHANTATKEEKPAGEALDDEAVIRKVEELYQVNAEPEPAPAPDVKLSDIQGLVVRLATTGKKAEARDIVKAYAERVTEIPPEKYGEAFAKLKKLEG